MKIKNNFFKTREDANRLCDEKNDELIGSLHIFKYILKDYDVQIDGSCEFYVDSIEESFVDSLKYLLSFGLWEPKVYCVRFQMRPRHICSLKIIVRKERVLTEEISGMQLRTNPKVLIGLAESILKVFERHNATFLTLESPPERIISKIV